LSQGRQVAKKDFGGQIDPKMVDSEGEMSQQPAILVRMPKSPTMNGAATFENSPRLNNNDKSDLQPSPDYIRNIEDLESSDVIDLRIRERPMS
jgi:hypothetical protein